MPAPARSRHPTASGWRSSAIATAGIISTWCRPPAATPVQITKGEFEAWRPTWSPDSTRIAFDANEPGKPGNRHLGVATIGERSGAGDA